MYPSVHPRTSTAEVWRGKGSRGALASSASREGAPGRQGRGRGGEGMGLEGRGLEVLHTTDVPTRAELYPQLAVLAVQSRAGLPDCLMRQAGMEGQRGSSGTLTEHKDLFPQRVPVRLCP